MELTTDALNTLMPLGTTLGLELVSADPQTVVGTVRWHERLTTAGGALHGGTLMALADSVGGAVAFLNLPEGAGTSTISSSTVFIRGAREGVVTATGRLVHRGRTTMVWQTKVTRQDGKLAAIVTQTQLVIDRR